jgi:hypothetical protein
MAREVGCVGVVVDAKPPAVGFYQKFGFQKVADGSGGIAARMLLGLNGLPATPAASGTGQHG